MLIYHPAYDAYHCIFRMLAVIKVIPSLEVDKARLLDFYLLFPSAMSKIRLPQPLFRARQIAKTAANIYRDPINPSATFRELHHIQEAALKCIAASGIIDIDKYAAGIVVRTELAIPESLAKQLDVFVENQAESARFVLNELSTIPLKGINGLKDRTELMEYRYDVT